jgi:hypothetical protein
MSSGNQYQASTKLAKNNGASFIQSHAKSPLVTGLSISATPDDLVSEDAA